MTQQQISDIKRLTTLYTIHRKGYNKIRISNHVDPIALRRTWAAAESSYRLLAPLLIECDHRYPSGKLTYRQRKFNLPGYRSCTICGHTKRIDRMR